MDESATGFSLLVDRLAGIEVKQKAQLHTNAGWFAVRVVHIAEIAPPRDDETPITSDAPWFRLGLLRLGDVMASEEPTASRWTDGLRCSLGDRGGAGGVLAAFGLLVAILALVLLATWMLGYFRAERPAANDWRTPSSASESTSDQPLPNLPPSRNDASPSSDERSSSSNRSSTFGLASDFGADHGRVQNSKPSSASRNHSRNHWHENALRLPGASPFALPQVAEELQLTSNQQQQIAQLIETNSQAMRDLNDRIHGQQREKISQQRAELFDKAQREALGVLTAEQRAKWEKLTAGQ